MLRSNYYYWKGVLDKIIPVKYQGYIFLISFVFIVFALIMTDNENSKINNDFYELKLNDKVSEMILKEEGFHYKIDSNWFLIKHIIVNHISIGDSILKDSNSFDIIIKGSDIIKWNSSVNRNIIFKIISSENKNIEN